MTSQCHMSPAFTQSSCQPSPPPPFFTVLLSLALPFLIIFYPNMDLVTVRLSENPAHRFSFHDFALISFWSPATNSKESIGHQRKK